MTTLMVASSGGHLMELLSLAGQLDLTPPVLWVTNETVMSRSVLCEETVLWRPYIGPRNIRGALSEATAALGLLRSRRFERVFSTGGAIALSYLPTARALGSTAVYIESAARVGQLSLTGRVMRTAPGIEVLTQASVSARLRQVPSVFGGFSPLPATPREIRSVCVLLGTERFSFRRLLERLERILTGHGCVVTWQTGHTPTGGLGITPTPWLAYNDLLDVARSADVVVCHGGVGSVLTAFLAGKLPVVVPRQAVFEEHVDDHQVEMVRDLAARRLAVASFVEDLSLSTLESAAANTVVRSVASPSSAPVLA